MDISYCLVRHMRAMCRLCLGCLVFDVLLVESVLCILQYRLCRQYKYRCSPTEFKLEAVKTRSGHASFSPAPLGSQHYMNCVSKSKPMTRVPLYSKITNAVLYGCDQNMFESKV